MNDESHLDKPNLYQQELSVDIDGPQKKRRRMESNDNTDNTIDNSTQDNSASPLKSEKGVNDYTEHSHVLSTQEVKSIAVKSLLSPRPTNEGSDILDPKVTTAEDSDLGSLLILPVHRNLALRADKDLAELSPNKMYQDGSKASMTTVNLMNSTYPQSPLSLLQCQNSNNRLSHEQYQQNAVNVNTNVFNFLAASFSASIGQPIESTASNVNLSDLSYPQPSLWLPQSRSTIPNILHLGSNSSILPSSGISHMSSPYLSSSSNHEIIQRGPLLHFPTDNEFLSEPQIFIRKQIEFFEVASSDVGKTTSGRKRPIRLNQVGIQCRHCSVIPIRYRERGAVYFPAKSIGIYQAAQNMVATHMIQLCRHIDNETKTQLMNYRKCRTVTGHGGKKYWAETAKAQGIVDSESENGLIFETRYLESKSSSFTGDSNFNMDQDKKEKI